MSLRFQILGSSSSGNCALIESNETKILLDAGFSGRKILQKLSSIGKDIEGIDAVFLTHEHGDHTAGMRGLSRFEHLSFYANEPTARAVQSKLSKSVKWKLFQTGTTFRHKDLTIETIQIPHDAYEPVAFVIRSGNGDLFQPHRSIAWLTDLGYIPSGVAEKIRNVDLLVIEANHDPELLESNMKRPFSVKQRILGRHGHLSNRAAYDFLNSINEPSWRAVFLAHISKDCNCLSRIKELFQADQNSWSTIIVDPDGEPSGMLDLGISS